MAANGLWDQASDGVPTADGRVAPFLLLTLRIFFVLAVGAVAGLYLGSGRTEDFFAWTIQPPLTAAMLGAAYTGSLALFGLTARGGPWARLRCAVPAPFVLSSAMLITTLVHLDRFHLGRGDVAGAVAWIWLVVYIAVPFLLATAWLVHRRRPAPRLGRDLPGWAIAAAWAAAAGAAVLGAVLLVGPGGALARGWPWALTPLTARALGSWLLAAAAALGHVAADADLVRVRPLIAALTATGVFGLGALARYPSEIPSGAGMAAMVVTFGLLATLGGAGLWAARRVRPDGAGLPPSAL